MSRVIIVAVPRHVLIRATARRAIRADDVQADGATHKLIALFSAVVAKSAIVHRLAYLTDVVGPQLLVVLDQPQDFLVELMIEHNRERLAWCVHCSFRLSFISRKREL